MARGVWWVRGSCRALAGRVSMLGVWSKHPGRMALVVAVVEAAVGQLCGGCGTTARRVRVAVFLLSAARS
eukprot:6118919-Alexandrium_andersonii.AAC.1